MKQEAIEALDHEAFAIAVHDVLEDEPEAAPGERVLLAVDVDLAPVRVDDPEDVDPDEMDAEERVEIYGKVERARGVCLTYESTHEQMEAADSMDAPDDVPDGWTGRLRAAWRTLRGREPNRDPGRDPSGGPPLLADEAQETGEVLEEYADGLGDHLVDLDDDADDDLRMFQ